jgi:ribose transport system permease protein
MVVAGIVLARTCFGRYTYAIGSNAEAARRAGIKVGRHVVVLFTIMGLLAGVAGAMDIARFTTTSVIAHGADNLIAIAAVVIGGASLFGGSGTMFRTAIGVLIPAVLTTGLIIANVQSFWQEVIIGAILICAVAIDNVKRSSETKAG